MNAQARLAALFLLLAPGPLAEVLSGNVPLLTFLQPCRFSSSPSATAFRSC
jgi:hypothetical protein